jgi:hypothetical protein
MTSSSEGLLEMMEQDQVKVMMHPEICLDRHFVHAQKTQKQT